MVLSVAMMLTMFPTGVLADDFVNDKENTAGVTDIAEGQSNENQGEGSDTTKLNVVEDEEAQPETVQPENEQTEPEQTENDQTEPTQNETDQAKPEQTETDQTEQPEPGSTVPDQAGTQPDDKQPEPDQPATDPAENGASDGAESTEGEQAESKTEFTVTWESEGETILTKTFAEGTSKDEVENAQPAEDPVKEADGDVAYEFAGWTPDYAEVTADQTYTATFKEASQQDEQDEMLNTASLVEPADIKDQSVSLAVGDTENLTGSDTYNRGSNHGWSSSDSDAVSITARNGNTATVKANRASSETVTITHTYKQWKSGIFGIGGSWESHTDTWEITVTAPVAATSVAIEGADSVVVFREIQLTAKVEPTNAAGPYTWSSSNEEILTVDDSGKVTGKKPGTATVTLVVGSGNTAKSASKAITVTASTETTDKAQVYNLLEPGKNVNSNDVSNWNGPLDKNAEVDVTGAYWTGGKNCFDNVANRVVKWPTGYENGIVPRSDSQWNTIFEKYKERTLNELADAGITNYNIQESDVAYIKLVPEKISKDNGTTPDKHLDCSVVVQCKGIATAIFKLKDAGLNTSFDQVGEASSYLVNGTHNVITSPEAITGQEFPATKTVGGVDYTFSGWYTNDKLEGEAVDFSNGYALPEGTTTFYAKYTAGYQVTYDLQGGSWGNSDPTQYTADEGSIQVVKAKPSKAGYKFTGWTVEGLGDTTTLESGKTFTMPGNEVKFTATWQANEVTVTITGRTATHTYNGTEQQVTGYDVKTSNPEYTASDFTFTGNAAAKGTDVGTYNMGLTAEQFKNNNPNFAKVTFKIEQDSTLTIKPVAIELTANSNSKAYDGKALTDSGYKITNGKFVGEEGLESVTVEGSQTLVGSSDNTITAHALKANTEAKNYTISYKNGKLTVTDREDADKYQITVEANSDSKPYDGQSLTVNGFKTLSFEVEGNTYTVEGLSATATGTNVADSKVVEVKGTAKVLDVNGNDVTAQFKVETKNGSLTISPKEITVTADNKSKTYGDADPKLTATATGLVGEDTVDYTLSREPGEDVGTYTITPSGEAIQGNYKVSFADGKLEITPKNIVPGDNNKDLTATAPKDVVYSGESQQQKPIVKDGDKVLEEDTDYTLSYSEDTTNAGTVTVTITGKGNYDGKFEVTYEITPASLKIITNSAEKTYDGSALTAEGKIEGLVKGETATLKTTGSQTEVGESKNTYTIEWDGSAKKANYKIAEEDIGTLKVNARSGGGSSSKPTPEDEPTPTPTPTPLPTLPTTPAPTTPTRRVTRSTATVTQPASRPTEQITENETPKAESEPEVIEDEETPLAPMAGGAWALVNLILMLLTVLASLLLLLGYLGKKKYAKEDEYGNALHDANGNEIIDYTRNKKGFWRVASLIPAIAAVIAFALTENMRLPMVMTDRWTLLMVIIAVVQLIVAVLCKKKKESEEDENQANA